jgi:hypothetical protein
MNWGSRGRRNAGNRWIIGEELIRRLETLEARQLHEEHKNLRKQVDIIEPMERLIDVVTNQGVRTEVSKCKGDLNPDLFIDWIQELKGNMENIGEYGPKRV